MSARHSRQDPADAVAVSPWAARAVAPPPGAGRNPAADGQRPTGGSQQAIRDLLDDAVLHYVYAAHDEAYRLLVEIRSRLEQGVAAFDGDGDTATRYLARTLLDLHRPADACQLIEDHVADLESVYLLHDEETALAVVTLADTRRALGDLDAAETGYRRVAELRPPAGDNDDRVGWVVLQAEAGLALATADRGDPRAAATRLAEILIRLTRRYGWRDYDTLRIAANLAGLRLLLHDPDGVRDLTDVVYPEAVATFGAEHWLARHLASLADQADRHPRPAMSPPAPPAVRGGRRTWLVVLAVLLVSAAVVAGALFGLAVAHGALSGRAAGRPTPAVARSGRR